MKAIFLIVTILLIFANYALFNVGTESDLVTWLIMIWGVCVLIDIYEKVKK